MAKTFDIIKVLEVTEQNLNCFAQKNLYRYWLKLKAGNRLPEWKDFDPSAIRDSLPAIMLIDAFKDGDFFISITGEQCRENLGIKTTRSPLDEALPANALPDVKTRLSHVLNTRRPHLVTKRMSWKSEDSPELQQQTYTVLFLPFNIDHDKVKLKILNSLHFH